MVEQRIENSCVAGSSPACGTRFRMLTANKKTFIGKSKTASCFICARSIMDNTLGYELSNGGSIPSGRTNRTLALIVQWQYNTLVMYRTKFDSW